MLGASVVNLIRHGPIPDYLTDRQLIAEGQQVVLNTGKKLAEKIQDREFVRFHCSPSRRTRQTASLLYKGLSEAMSHEALIVSISPDIIVDDHLQNIQFYIDGLSYDTIQPMLDVVRWRFQQTPSHQYETHVTYQTEFWSTPDPVDYWMTHPSKVIESPDSVAKRTWLYIAECFDTALGKDKPMRNICVTHSSNIRAFLRIIFGDDPGKLTVNDLVTISSNEVRFKDRVGEFPKNILK